MPRYRLVNIMRHIPVLESMLLSAI